jgi:hypothetical protein
MKGEEKICSRCRWLRTKYEYRSRRQRLQRDRQLAGSVSEGDCLIRLCIATARQVVESWKSELGYAKKNR